MSDFACIGCVASVFAMVSTLAFLAVPRFRTTSRRLGIGFAFMSLVLAALFHLQLGTSL